LSRLTRAALTLIFAAIPWAVIMLIIKALQLYAVHVYA